MCPLHQQVKAPHLYERFTNNNLQSHPTNLNRPCCTRQLSKDRPGPSPPWSAILTPKIPYTRRSPKKFNHNSHNPHRADKLQAKRDRNTTPHPQDPKPKEYPPPTTVYPRPGLKESTPECLTHQRPEARQQHKQYHNRQDPTCLPRPR